MAPETVLDILERHDRCAAGTSMPAEALFLFVCARSSGIRVRWHRSGRGHRQRRESVNTGLCHMHNLFGDTNAVHISVYKDSYEIDQIIEGETVDEQLVDGPAVGQRLEEREIAEIFVGQHLGDFAKILGDVLHA